MVKTIPQLQIKKHLGNSHFRESIPRQKFGESNQQQPLILRVTRIKNPSRNSIRQILNFTKEKIKKSKSRVEQPANVVLPNKKTFTEFVLSNVETM